MSALSPVRVTPLGTLWLEIVSPCLLSLSAVGEMSMVHCILQIYGSFPISQEPVLPDDSPTESLSYIGCSEFSFSLQWLSSEQQGASWGKCCLRRQEEH